MTYYIDFSRPDWVIASDIDYHLTHINHLLSHYPIEEAIALIKQITTNSSMLTITRSSLWMKPYGICNTNNHAPAYDLGNLGRLLSAIANTVSDLDLSVNIDINHGDSTPPLVQYFSFAKFKHILGAIPGSVKRLNLSFNVLYLLSGAQLAEAFATLIGVTHLELGNNDFGKMPTNKPGEPHQLVIALQGLATTVKHLGLKDNLKGLSFTTLLSVMTSLPKHIRSLDLSNNPLGMLSDSEIRQFLATIPAHIDTLNLSDCKLGKLANFDSFCCCLPYHIRSLDIGDNYLFSSEDDIDDMKTALSHLPTTLEHLDINHNNVNHGIAEEEGIELLDSLPPSLKRLRFILNVSGIFCYLPATITELDLSNHCFQDYDKTDDIIDPIATAPNTVTSLNLNDNTFTHLSGTEVAKLFASLPDNIQTLRLEGCFFRDEFNKDETFGYDKRLENMVFTNFLDYLKKLAQSLPYIETIYLSYDEVRQMSWLERQALRAVCPAIKNVWLVDCLGDTMPNTPLVAHYRWSLGDKAAPPSLLNQCAFFVRNKFTPDVSSAAIATLPDDVQSTIATNTASDLHSNYTINYYR